jgi:non-ribosomal peptide synthetase component F
VDLRRAASFRSGASGFGEAIKGGPAAFVTINLEHGRAWLSSRLYVFVQALREVRGIEAVVFTERTEPIDQTEPIDHFVGVAAVGDVVARLEWGFPWHAAAFGKAWEIARRADLNRPARRRLSPDTAERLYERYVAALRQPKQGPQPDEWQLLRDGLWERANWLDQATVKEILGSALVAEYVIGSLDREQTLSQAMTIGTARWIAVVNHNLAAPSLVDRWELLDRARRQTD